MAAPRRHVPLHGALARPARRPHRLRAGINHLALTVGTRDELDRVRAESTEHGWHEMYADRYPHAGGNEHVALYVESSEGFEVEVVVEE
ncbi:hypothetical protein L2K70_14645 [Nocardioides KLBMP 9356]|uniref:VOC domain-containing protein n=1 Tax=Nocardioides potassii TaxID=2911371 RepID=A0ABS9HCH4_9ACTN|nr:hypothetical protein [Nocardioides potassii]MCF6378851.1 hypothetical protein [Nocardioides potassii]